MNQLLVKSLLAEMLLAHAAFAADSLPSWSDTATKKAIMTFVEKVTREGSPDFVPLPERIATFDNDRTLWAEQPMYFQGLFLVDRVRALAPQHPEWNTREPFASFLKDDMQGVAAAGEKGLMEMLAATHTGMTTEEFSQTVRDWIATTRHPKSGKLYTEMVYQPMLALLAYLRANGFKTFIVSGGGIEFVRPWTERVYGIPPEQVVGSSVKLQFEMCDGRPVLVKLPAVDLIDDKEGKPVGIQSHIGRRPIAAFGNSDAPRTGGRKRGDQGPTACRVRISRWPSARPTPARGAIRIGSPSGRPNRSCAGTARRARRGGPTLPRRWRLGGKGC